MWLWCVYDCSGLVSRRLVWASCQVFALGVYGADAMAFPAVVCPATAPVTQAVVILTIRIEIMNITTIIEYKE